LSAGPDTPAAARQPGFFADLRRRNVFRAGLAWLALSWFLIALADLLLPALGLPDAAVRWLIIVLGLLLVPVMSFAWLIEITPEGIRIDRGPEYENPENARTARRMDQVTIVLLLMAIGLSAIRQFVLPQRVEAPDTAAVQVEQPAPEPAPQWVPAGEIDPRSIAVLPFANLSPDPENAYLADGMAEEILNVLARVEGLRVASRTSSFSLRDRQLAVRDIGHELGVANLLDGSVRRQGDELRITVQLVEAATDRQVWSGSFDRRLTDIFTLQEEIAQAVTDVLADTLGVREIQVRQPTNDLQAYELYLRGRQLFAQRGAALPPARELLEQAVDRDPRFAEAWAALGGVMLVLPSYFSDMPSDRAAEQARSAASRALALVPDLPEALAVSARLAAERGERLAAVQLMERALAQDPNNANSWMWHGLNLLEAGHVQAAREAFERANGLDPLSGIHFGWIGATQVIEGEHAAAEASLLRAHELGWRGPASAWLVKLALAEGYGAEAERRFRQWLQDDGRIAPEHRAVYEEVAPAMADPALRQQAGAAVAAASEAWPEREWSQLYLMLGLHDAAIREALRSKPDAGQILLLMAWSSVDRPFREHPRFAELAQRDGLLEFWARFGDPDYCRRVGVAPQRLECER
jgi:TolB-like protein/Tfp pilus assembly protein PilF